MPRVYNANKDFYPAEAVYIGRPSKWGNPYIIGKEGDRKTVIDLYEKWLYTSGRINDIEELRGKDLVCHCAPQACHGDVLIKLANKI